ncbi:MAG: hypothetical protein KDK90_27950 [Leptospiraceae bacterium]|nr:hypothetical protein [Leptospiraceae bacterium]
MTLLLESINLNDWKRTSHNKAYPLRKRTRLEAVHFLAPRRAFVLQASAVPSFDLEVAQSQHLHWNELSCSVTCRSGTSGML